MLYGVKPDLIRKARLICDGSRVDLGVLSTRVPVIKRVYVCQLDSIANS